LTNDNIYVIINLLWR